MICAAESSYTKGFEDQVFQNDPYFCRQQSDLLSIFLVLNLYLDIARRTTAIAVMNVPFAVMFLLVILLRSISFIFAIVSDKCLSLSRPLLSVSSTQLFCFA